MRTAAVAAGYFVAYQLGALWGREFETLPGFTPWFPPPGITLVLLIAFGLRYLPVVFVAELFSSLVVFDVDSTFTTAQLLLNVAVITLGYGAAAWLLLSVVKIRRDLRRGSDLAWLVAIGVVAAPVLVALGGTAIRFWADGGGWSGYFEAAKTWAIGDALGVVSLTPAALTIGVWWRRRVPDLIRSEFLNAETAAQTLAVVGTPFLVLALGDGYGAAPMIAVIPLVWVALRHSFEVTAGALLVATCATTVAADLQLGGGVAPTDIQLTLILFAVIALAVGWAVREQRRSSARLAHRALHDPLTGLPNRVRFLAETERRLAAGEQCALLYFDLARFKLVNDALGHEVGDQLLVQVARRLIDAVGERAFVARFGGDQFTALASCSEDPRADAREVAEIIIRALEAPFDLDGRRVLTSARVGVALGGGADPGTLLRRGDVALHEAKRGAHEGIAFFDAPMSAAAERRSAIEQGLRQSLETDDFTVAYQPIVALGDGSVEFAEALLRWRLGDEPVSPGEFVPVAQDTGLIVPLGRRVLAAACRDAATWPAQGDRPPAAVSVNVSPAQLRTPGLAQHARECLSASGLPPERLVIELTEDALLEDEASVVRALEELRAEGVRIALDDFGTGYSSLAYIERLPLDIVKLDREFVAELGTNERAEGVLSAAIDLAHAVGVPVVAEGVETPQQAQILFLLGCDFAQGYLFARPGAADQVLLAAGQRERPSGTFLVKTVQELGSPD